MYFVLFMRIFLSERQVHYWLELISRGRPPTLLRPGGTHAVAYLPRRDVGSHGNDPAHWLVA
jgi:hypothetical protein